MKPFPTIPRLLLLEKHCEGGVAARSDFVPIAGAIAGPAPNPKLSKHFKTGALHRLPRVNAVRWMSRESGS